MSSAEPLDVSDCTEVGPGCPVSASIYGDYFTEGACIFFAVCYGLLIAIQLLLGWRSRTWSFTSYLAIGSIFEFVGYIGRTIMSHNPYNNTAFIIQILFLILAPTLIAASISLTFKHLVLYYGPEHSMIRPRLYPWVFVGSDFVSIVIQGMGGAIAAASSGSDNPDPEKAELGSNLLIAGVSFQVVNMVVCGGIMMVYVHRYRAARNPAGRLGSSDTTVTYHSGACPESSVRTPRQDLQAKRFIWAITAAYIAIIIRCIYR